MFGLGIGEIVVILFIALIFIGPKTLPGLAKGLGKGIREFQNAAKGITDTINEPVQGVKDSIQQTKDQIINTEVAQNTPDEYGDVSPDHHAEDKVQEEKKS